MTSSAFESSLNERAKQAGLTLPAGFAVRAERFYDLLKKWNATTNLTALELDGYPASSLDRLFIEPLVAAELVPSDSALFCVDVGSGGGSPAIPFAVARPSVRVLMVESVGKKAAFLREAVRAVGLQRADVKQARFEDLVELKGMIDLVLIRGVRITRTLATALQTGLKKNGKLFVFGPRPDTAEFGWPLIEERPFSDENALLIFDRDR